jgi:hypothetical protein
LMFFIQSGNHKFYIQFSRLLGLQSFRITLYKDGNENVPIEDNYLEEERSDDFKYCLST